MKNPKLCPWCLSFLQVLGAELYRNSFSSDIRWDHDGEPEVFIVWPNREAAYGRLLCGQDGDGSHYGILSLGIQGMGEIQKHFEPDETSVKSLVEDLRLFRNMVGQKD